MHSILKQLAYANLYPLEIRTLEDSSISLEFSTSQQRNTGYRQLLRLYRGSFGVLVHKNKQPAKVFSSERRKYQKRSHCTMLIKDARKKKHLLGALSVLRRERIKTISSSAFPNGDIEISFSSNHVKNRAHRCLEKFYRTCNVSFADKAASGLTKPIPIKSAMTKSTPEKSSTPAKQTTTSPVETLTPAKQTPTL